MISVVIPCFNQGKFLHDCLNSIKKSSYRPLEVIIINDGSTDEETLNILKTIQNDFSDLDITVKHQENGGLSNARNEGLKIARGKFIQLLDCDDMIDAKKFETQVDLFEKYPEKSCILSDYYFITENGKIDTLPKLKISGHRLDLLDFLINWEKTLSIPIHCALFRRSVFNELKFLTDFKAKEDWIFWSQLSFIVGAQGFLYHGDRYAIYRLNSSSMTKNPETMLLEWIKAQTYLFAKFGHLLSDTELLKELNKNASYTLSSYIRAIKLQVPSEKQPIPTLKTVAINILQKFPALYKFIRNCSRRLNKFRQI